MYPRRQWVNVTKGKIAGTYKDVALANLLKRSYTEVHSTTIKSTETGEWPLVQFYYENNPGGRPLTAVMTGKLITALSEWLAMNQQQVAMAHSTPDRKPGTQESVHGRGRSSAEHHAFHTTEGVSAPHRQKHSC